MNYDTPRFRRLFGKRPLEPGPGGCTFWPERECDRYGYGRLGYKHERRLRWVAAHRLSYLLHHGPIPEGLEVMHACHNRRCVNPAHLSLGTHRENEEDKVRAGRSMKGERHGQSLITEEDAISLKERYEDGEPLKGLAFEYGLSYRAAYDIAHGRRWGHLHANDRDTNEGEG